MSFDLKLGTPFKLYQQLMGVLPVASMDHIPLAYQDLMYGPNSPILDFYPLEFEQDLNGKKQDWEAIVKIPFIDEERLLKAMAARDHRLTPEERKRNTWGSSSKFSFNSGEPTLYPSSLPGFFPLCIDARVRRSRSTSRPLMGCISFLVFATESSSVQKLWLDSHPSKRFHTRRCWDTTA